MPTAKPDETIQPSKPAKEDATSCIEVEVERSVPVFRYKQRAFLCFRLLLFLCFRIYKNISGDYASKGWGSEKIFLEQNSSLIPKLLAHEPVFFNALKELDNTNVAKVHDLEGNLMTKIKCGVNYGVLLGDKTASKAKDYALLSSKVELNGVGCIADFNKGGNSVSRQYILHFGFNTMVPSGDEGKTFLCAGLLDPLNTAATTGPVLCYTNFDKHELNKSITVTNDIVKFKKGTVPIWAMPRSIRRPLYPESTITLNRYGLCSYSGKKPDHFVYETEKENAQIIVEVCGLVMRQEDGLLTHLLSLMYTIFFVTFLVYAICPRSSRINLPLSPNYTEDKILDSVSGVDAGAYFDNHVIHVTRFLMGVESIVNLWQVYPELTQFRLFKENSIGDLVNVLSMILFASLSCNGLTCISSYVFEFFLTQFWQIISFINGNLGIFMIAFSWKPWYTRYISLVLSVFLSGSAFGPYDDQVLRSTNARWRFDGTKGFYCWGAGLRYSSDHLQLANSENLLRFSYSVLGLCALFETIAYVVCSLFIYGCSSIISENRKGLVQNNLIKQNGIEIVSLKLLNRDTPRLFLPQGEKYGTSEYLIPSNLIARLGIFKMKGQVCLVSSYNPLATLLKGLKKRCSHLAYEASDTMLNNNPKEMKNSPCYIQHFK